MFLVTDDLKVAVSTHHIPVSEIAQRITKGRIMNQVKALNECLNIQNKIYNLMAEKGWYQTENAEQQKITAAEQKYSNQNN